MNENGISGKVARIAIMNLCCLLFLFAGCKESQESEKQNVPDGKQIDAKTVEMYIQELGGSDLTYERKRVILKEIIDSSGLAGIEVLVDNLDSKSPVYVSELPPNGYLLVYCEETIGEICRYLLYEIIKPPELRGKSKMRYPDIPDWKDWVEKHRGMTMEEIRKEWPCEEEDVEATGMGQ